MKNNSLPGENKWYKRPLNRGEMRWSSDEKKDGNGSDDIQPLQQLI